MSQLRSQIPGPARAFNVAFAIQNAAGDLDRDAGEAILIKNTVRELWNAGHHVSIFKLQGNSVIRIDHPPFSQGQPILSKWTGSKWFRRSEGVVRRLQKELRIPYVAVLDGLRFYEVCYKNFSQYDLCHEYAGLFSTGAAMACRRLGIPYILTVDADAFLENEAIGRPIRGIRGLVGRFEARLIYKLADRIICVSAATRKRLIDHWRVRPEKIVVLPNGADTSRFTPDCDGQAIRTRFGLHGNQVVGFVGGFQPWHGLDHLLEAFQIVNRQNPRVKLLLVGDGRARDSLECKIRQLGIVSSVTITGFVPHAEVPNYLAAADVAVLPYPKLRSELWFSPLKLFEYMAAGKAVIATGDGQVSEIVRHGYNGVLVRSGNVEHLAAAIKGLLENDVERARLGRNARRQAVERHSWTETARQLERVYLECLEKPDERAAGGTGG